MASFVKLKPEHLDTIIDVLEDVVKWKSQSLSVKAWTTFETDYLPSVIEQIRDNEFRLNHITRNTPLWIVDQIMHTRVLNSSGNKRNAVALYDTLKGKRAIEILRAAAKGQIYYDGYYTTTTFSNLFN